jgi:hypothetical protein
MRRGVASTFANGARARHPERLRSFSAASPAGDRQWELQRNRPPRYGPAQPASLHRRGRRPGPHHNAVGLRARVGRRRRPASGARRRRRHGSRRREPHGTASRAGAHTGRPGQQHRAQPRRPARLGAGRRAGGPRRRASGRPDRGALAGAAPTRGGGPERRLPCRGAGALPRSQLGRRSCRPARRRRRPRALSPTRRARRGPVGRRGAPLVPTLRREPSALRVRPQGRPAGRPDRRNLGSRRDRRPHTPSRAADDRGPPSRHAPGPAERARLARGPGANCDERLLADRRGLHESGCGPVELRTAVGALRLVRP